MSNVMLLYKEVTALSRDAHMNTKFKPVEDFSFAAESHWMPVAGAEFYQVARYYPIVFVQENEEFRSILLLGLEPNRNEFIESNRKWKSDTYIPAFARRYPFVLADNGSENGELTVCIDPTYMGWNTREGKELFNADGTNSSFLNDILQFINGFNVEMQRTNEFCKELDQQKLLIKRSVDIRSPDGQTFKVQDLFMVDEEALGKMSATELEKFNKLGMLGWIFAHQMSLTNLPPLFDLYRLRKAVQNPATKAKK